MTAPINCCLVPTAFGAVGLGWTANGIARVNLPEDSEAATLARVSRGAEPGRPDGTAAVAAHLLQRYFAGEVVALDALPLDLSGVPEFNLQVYTMARTVGQGAVSTYGAIAEQLGGLVLSRAVGQALGTNPVPIIVPCHRILAADGRIGGFSAFGGRVTKQRLLELEGAPVQLALL